MGKRNNIRKALRALQAASALIKPVEGMSAADIDFCRMMIRHHEIAVEMAGDILAQGQHPRVQTIAHFIKYTQPFEIRAMLQLLSGLPMDKVLKAPISLPPKMKMVKK